MNKTILITASLLGFLSILIGAFGAHGLKPLLSNAQLISFETGVRYQMYHALLLLFISQTSYITEKTKRILWYTIVLGILLFSGSIFGLATNNLTSFNFKSVALLTPIGGVLMLTSWGILFIKFIKIRRV